MGEGRVLIVEDEAMVSMMLDDLISLANGKVVGIAETLDAGLEMIEYNNYDMVILDVSLAGESSEPIAAKLKEYNVPVVVATGSYPGGLPQAYKGFPVASKPFRVGEVMELVQKMAF